MARTFADLIRTVSRNLGDLYEGNLTGVSSTTVLLDSGRTQGDGWWTGGNLALTSGPSAGQERSVTGWLQSGGTFVTDAFLLTPNVSDAYELRRRPKHTRVAVKEFINQAVREVMRQSWVQVDSYLGLSDRTLYTRNRLEYTAPAGLEMVHRILYLDIPGHPQAVSLADIPAEGNAGDYYYLSSTGVVVEWNTTFGDWIGGSTRIPWVELDQDQWNTTGVGTIQIQVLEDYADWDRSTSPVPDSALLRFIGSKRPTEFVNDTDQNAFEGNYLEVFATARMCLRLAEGAQDESDFNTKFQMFYKLESDAFRGTRRGLPTGSRKVRA